MSNKLSASEAVYGFVAWLATRNEPTIMSSNHSSAPVVDLMLQFCDNNGLGEPQDDYHFRLTKPQEEDKEIHSPDYEAGFGVESIVYQRPAIVIIERSGEAEITREFATKEDYKAWKELQG